MERKRWVKVANNKAKRPAKAKRTQPPEEIFQLKITLLGVKPSIWRRMQIIDCSLDELHEYIQTAMGWTNSHLHHFRIGEQFYGDPMLMQESMEELDYEDSTKTMLSDVLRNHRKGFRFHYEYDFGDSWDHEILFEGCEAAQPGRKFPICLGGKRACPPEDVGGVWGYADLLQAIQDPHHERHDELLEWMGGPFDAEEFDAAAATKSMKKGLPDWRKML